MWRRCGLGWSHWLRRNRWLPRRGRGTNRGAIVGVEHPPRRCWTPGWLGLPTSRRDEPRRRRWPSGRRMKADCHEPDLSGLPPRLTPSARVAAATFAPRAHAHARASCTQSHTTRSGGHPKVVRRGGAFDTFALTSASVCLVRRRQVLTQCLTLAHDPAGRCDRRFPRTPVGVPPTPGVGPLPG